MKKKKKIIRSKKNYMGKVLKEKKIKIKLKIKKYLKKK
jgi:hypothetical protein